MLPVVQILSRSEFSSFAPPSPNTNNHDLSFPSTASSTTKTQPGNFSGFAFHQNIDASIIKVVKNHNDHYVALSRIA
jgi:hypothetical protein